MSQTFTRVDDEVLCKTIAQARQRLVFIAPGIRPLVAQALAKAMTIVPTDAIHLVLDVDAEVCRLGYGDKDFKGMEILQVAAAGNSLTVNHHPGIRIGLLIADDTTLIYSPTPELIEAESRQPDKPNAIILRNALPEQLADACAVGKSGFAKVEVGLDQINRQAVEEVKRDLQDRPPKEFNVARVERVFSSLLQYVELKIEGYKLSTRTLSLNAELFGVRDPEVISRLTNKYRLFSQPDALTVEIPRIGTDGKPDDKEPKENFGLKSIDKERSKIKAKFVIEAGEFGSLILRRDVAAFEKEISLLKAKVTEYKKAVHEQIDASIEEIVDELLAALRESLKSSPPAHWQSRYLGKEPTAEDVERLFREDVEKEVQRVRTDFEPKVSVTYKEVTYQTFKTPEFREFVEKRFGKPAISAILREHDAAPEEKSTTSEKQSLMET